DRRAWDYEQRGDAYRKADMHRQATDDYHSAIGEIDKLIAQHKHCLEGYVKRGGIYRKIKKYQLAVDDYTSALDLKRGYAQALQQRAETLVEMARYEEAVADLTAAIELGISPHGRRADLYAKLGQNAKALQDLDICVADSRHPPDY